MENTRGGVILFKKLQATPPYGCFSRYFSFIIENAKPTRLFFKLYELFQIAQSINIIDVGPNNAHWRYQW